MYTLVNASATSNVEVVRGAYLAVVYVACLVRDHLNSGRLTPFKSAVGGDGSVGPSVGLRGDENSHPGSGLSALPSRKGTHCSHMAGDILSAKKIATFCPERGALWRAEMYLPERVELQSLPV